MPTFVVGGFGTQDFCLSPQTFSYFIDFEFKNCEHRKVPDARDNILRREAPTSRIYKKYQATSAVIIPDTIGGQYHSIKLS